MKFTKTKNSPKFLKEALTRSSISSILAVLESIFDDKESYDITEDELKTLELAYDILFELGGGLEENLLGKNLEESFRKYSVKEWIDEQGWNPEDVNEDEVAFFASETSPVCGSKHKDGTYSVFGLGQDKDGLSYKKMKHLIQVWDDSVDESLKEASDGRVRLHVEFYPYERYGGGGLKKANVSGKDKLDALKRLTDRMGLYIDSEVIEENDYSFEDAINSIAMSNGDGCDFIVVLQDRDTGEIYFSENYSDEEDWDDMDESLTEASEVNLSDKSNSISGLLLDHKDDIDAALSHADLVKVCSNILADKGGAKAQQFLSVLKSKKNHYAALKYVYDFILAGEGMRSPDSRKKTKSVQRREAIQRGENISDI